MSQLKETACPVADLAYAELGWESTLNEAGLRATIDFMRRRRAPVMRMLTTSREVSGQRQAIRRHRR